MFTGLVVRSCHFDVTAYAEARRLAQRFLWDLLALWASAHTLLYPFFTGCAVEMNVGYNYYDIASEVVENHQACADHCAFLHSSGLSALFWTFQTDSKICYVKNSDAGREATQNRISGNSYCGDTPSSGMYHPAFS